MPLAPAILHAIRAFREDLRTNPLSRLTWGIEPKSRRRRLKVLRVVLLPPLALIGLYSLFLFGILPVPFESEVQSTDLSEIDNIGDFCELNRFLLLGAIYLWAPLVLIVRGLQMRSVHHLVVNREDYRLAGLSGRQILWPTMGPWFLGLVAAMILYTPVCLATTLYFVVDQGGRVTNETWFWVAVFYSPVFSILALAFLDTALLAFAPHVLSRLFDLISTGFLTSPAWIFLIAALTGVWWIDRDVVHAEFITWPIRGLIVAWVWHRAIRKLEAGE